MLFILAYYISYVIALKNIVFPQATACGTQMI
jgi:hypothetical protein